MASLLEMLFGKRDDADQEIGSLDEKDHKFSSFKDDADLEIGSFDNHKDRKFSSFKNDADLEIGSFDDHKDRKFSSFKNDADLEIGSFDDRTVSWHPTNARPGDSIHIHYHGALKNTGANDLHLHYGFDGWHSDINTIRMAKNDDGDFVAEVKAAADREVNFCFKDIKGNWDNNHGKDWALPLQD